MIHGSAQYAMQAAQVSTAKHVANSKKLKNFSKRSAQQKKIGHARIAV